MEKESKNPAILSIATTQFKDSDALVCIAGWIIGKSENTKTIYGKILADFFAEFRFLPISEYNTGHITYFLKKSTKDKSGESFNLARACLSSFFSYAVKTGKISKNPVAVIKKVKTSKTKHLLTVNPDQVNQMLKRTLNKRDRLVIKMLYYLGLRASELCSVRMDSFMIRGDSVYLNIVGKGKKLRTIPIEDDLYFEIVGLANELGIVAGFLFLKERTRVPIDRHMCWYIIRSSAIRAKVQPLPHPHTFRHTCATLALEGGAPIHTVQHRLGHASLATTQIYLHPKPEEALSKYIQKLEE